MRRQEVILNEFRRIFSCPTFREISKKTGIQQTRVFRLFNGTTMNVSEYEIFNSLINKLMLTHSRTVDSKYS